MSAAFFSAVTSSAFEKVTRKTEKHLTTRTLKNTLKCCKTPKLYRKTQQGKVLCVCVLGGGGGGGVRRRLGGCPGL